MNHLMVDLETLGTENDSIFLSVAAVFFDPNTGKLGPEFSMNVQEISARAAGRTHSQSTLDWWKTKDPKIMARMYVDPKPLNDVLLAFKQFCKDCIGDVGLVPWGNSASFDLGMLGHAYRNSTIRQPWNPFMERCYRTVVAEFGKSISFPPKPAQAHDPIVDCKYQIQKLSMVYQKLKL